MIMKSSTLTWLSPEIKTGLKTRPSSGPGPQMPFFLTHGLSVGPRPNMRRPTLGLESKRRYRPAYVWPRTQANMDLTQLDSIHSMRLLKLTP